MSKPFADMGECGLCCCWIAPDGTSTHLYEGTMGWNSHCQVASDQLGDESGGRGLDNKGYMHVSYGSPYMGGHDQVPTQAQLDTLFDIQQELIKRRPLSRSADYIHSYLKAVQEKVTQ